MTKHLLLILLLFAAPLCGYSQAKITTGTPYGVVDAPDKFYFYRGQEILGVKINKKNVITLQKWNAAKLQFRNIRVYNDMPKDYVLERVLEFNERYFIFYSLWDKKNGLEQLFYREVDFSKGEFMGGGTLLLKVEGKITGSLTRTSFYRYGIQDKFDFHTSYDQSKLLVQYRLKPAIRSDAKNYDIIGMSVFNQDLSPAWNKEVEMPYTEKKMDNLDYTIDSWGNTYILTTVFEDNTTDLKKSKKGPANYHIELLRVNAFTAEIDITPITLADKFINKIWFYENAASHLVCAGFYNKGNVLSSANGVLLFNVDQDGKVADMATYEIPLEVLNQYESRKVKRKNEKKDKKDDAAEFEELELQELILEDDGSLLLIGEQNYIRSHTHYNGKTSTTTYTYHYDDLLVTKIDSQGALAWMRKLPKRQVGARGKGGMSYKYMRKGDEHYFLFLDNEKNMELPIDKVPARHADGAGGFLTAYTVNNGSGEVKKSSILDTRDVEGMAVYQFLTTRILPLPSNSFIFEVYKKKKEDIWVRVEFK